MSIYNSKIGVHEEESDITIINASIVDEHCENGETINSYVPILTRLKQANHLSDIRQSADRSNENFIQTDQTNYRRPDYIFVEHDSQESAKQLESVLDFYVQDLTQANRTQLDCDRLLINRLMDLIRAAYSADQQKMIALDKVRSEINSLHDKRHVEQNEKIQQLQTEIHQLNQRIFLLEGQSPVITNYPISRPLTIEQPDLADGLEQWTEIEGDTNKLQEIVRSQQNQIQEIVALMSEVVIAGETSPAIETTNSNASKNVTPPAPVNSLLQRFQMVTTQNPIVECSTLQNPSPGISPTQSLETLTLRSLNGASNAAPVQVEPIVVNAATPVASNEMTNCPICGLSFSTTPAPGQTTIYDHLENCLTPYDVKNEKVDFTCPACGQKFPCSDETTYHQHLSDCFNRDDYQ